MWSVLVARSGKDVNWLVKFFFSIIAIVHFLPVLMLAVIGAGLIYIHGKIMVLFFSSVEAKYSKFGCTITSILASVSAFSLMLFIVEKGNVKTTRKIRKAVFAVSHLGSGDYFIAAILALFHNWRVMIGANLWKYKIFHWFFNVVGIPIERENGANKKRAEALHCGKNFLADNKDSRLIVFPQGTRERNPENGFNDLKTGAFRIAHDLGVPLIPVTIIGTDKWRKPWKQDTTNQKGKKQNIFNLILSYAHQFFKTGINPTIVKVVYGNPVSSVGKTVEELKDEIELVINQTYFAYTEGKKRYL
jgi:1-acyl-sn-glycerol-3-phosphate acyltransferase